MALIWGVVVLLTTLFSSALLSQRAELQATNARQQATETTLSRVEERVNNVRELVGTMNAQMKELSQSIERRPR